MLSEKELEKEFYKEKIEEYGAKIKSDPNNAKNYHLLARARVDRVELTKLPIDKGTEYNRAIKVLDQAIALEKDADGQMWNYHLRARAKTGLREYEPALKDLGEAFEAFEASKAIKLHEQNWNCQMWNYHLRARIHLEKEMFDEALADIKKAENIDPLEYKNYKLKKDIEELLERNKRNQ